MSEQYGDQPWFRLRSAPFGFGYHIRPASWQGWVSTLVLVFIILVTAFLGDGTGSRPDKAAQYLRMKTMLGLDGTHLQMPVVLGAIVLECALFFFFARWKCAPLRPLD